MRYVLAACLLCSIPSAQAGTITGSEGGTATIEITQYLRGSQVGQTVDYQDIAAQLTYSVFPPAATVIQGINIDPFPQGSFEFDLATAPYSHEVSLEPNVGDPMEGFSTTLDPGVVLWFLSVAIYHEFSLRADLILSASDNALLGAGFYLNTSDTSGSGEIVSASFTPGDPPSDPPASVPEPSSFWLAMSGTIVLALSWSLKCVFLEAG